MRSQITAMAFAVAAFTVPQAALAQGGNEPFCLQSSTGATNCIYGSMQQCEQARTGQTNQTCVPRQGTVGAGGGRPSTSTDLPGGEQPGGGQQRPGPTPPMERGETGSPSNPQRSGETPDANRPR
jgi:hypothetical protein